MKSQKIIQKINQLVLLFFILWVLSSITTKVEANSLNNSNIKTITPEDNLTEAIKELQAGDTLILQNGVYHQALELREVHGTPDQPIIIKAENDGQAIIDGELKRRAIFIRDSSYLRLEGLFAKDGWSNWDKNVVYLDNAHHITLARITAYKSQTLDRNQFPFKINEGSHHILIEDSAGYGSSRKILMAEANTHHIVVRRFFSRWDTFERRVDPDPAVWIVGTEFYGGERVGHDNVFENVMTYLGDNPNLPSHSISAGGGDRHKVLGSVSLQSNTTPFDFSGCSHCLFQDNVAIKPLGKRGFVTKTSREPYFAAIENNEVSNFTWISEEADSQAITLGQSEAERDSLTVKHSFFRGDRSSQAFGLGGSNSQGELSHSHNVFYGFAKDNLYNDYHLQFREAYQGQSAQRLMRLHEERLLGDDPFAELLAIYGNGAYLMASRTELAGQGEDGSQVGAEVLYQYESTWDLADEEAPVNTTLTDAPLWPWAMEERICAETAQLGDGVHGTSVTYEAHTIEYDYDGDGHPETYNCSGGIWKSLDDVYEDALSSIDTNEQPVPQLTPPGTATEPIAINLAAGESIIFNCDGKRLVLERNNKTRVVGVCRPHQN